MVCAHRRMGRENADDNETFRRAGHCNRPTMRLLGSIQAVAYTHRRIPTAARAPASGRKGLPGVRIVQTRKRELAIVISTVGRREREETFPWRTSDDETRGEAEERQRTRSERESEGDREGERGRRKHRCGYGYMATPHEASQRALHRPTTHLTPQWADPRSYARWLCHALFPLLCASRKRNGNARVDEVCVKNGNERERRR